MRYVRAPILFLLICSGCASTPHNRAFDKYPAGVLGHTTVVYYDVKGRTFEELQADMRRLGPRNDGRSYVGETWSPMSWKWEVASSGAQCTIRDVTVSLDARITLPRWDPPADADSALVAEWKRFLLALETHESGHKDISAKAGREIINRLQRMTELCSMINMSANNIARMIVDDAAVEQKKYDAETRHGLTQGTTFSRPPRK